MVRVFAAGYAAVFCMTAGLATGFAPGEALALGKLQDGTPIRPDDARRLEGLDLSYGKALRQALNDADDQTIFAIIAALRGQPQPVDHAEIASLVGQWQCNMTKIGGVTAGVIYPPYRCEIRKEGEDYVFEKQTGSQLTQGTLHYDGTRIVYLGTDYIRGTNPPAYDQLPSKADPTSVTQFYPDAGILEVTGPAQARIILPEPHLESDLNVLTLTR